MIKSSAHRRRSTLVSTSKRSDHLELPRSTSTHSRRAKTPSVDATPRHLGAIRVWVKTDALWALLSQMCISQNELARRAGITGAYLSQLVNRKRSPSIQTVRRLLAALGASSFSDIFAFEHLDES